MTRACSVYGCSNKSTEKTIHGFPKDKKVRRDWVKFVDLKRANFVLTNNSGICQDHFVREDYDCPPATFSLKSQFMSRSQKLKKGVPEGNIAISAAILFAGCVASKVIRLFHFANIFCICLKTFFTHQKKYLFGTIQEVWMKHQTRALGDLRNTENLILAGDARCDSMGHCAKYGTYSLMDTKTSKVLLFNLIQSTEVKSSYHMELEGLKRCLQQSGTSDNMTLVTDRHLQVDKYLREEQPSIVHYYDVWHVAKGLDKKLIVLGKKYPAVEAWRKSIKNHLYWCASSSGGNGALVVAKWESLLNHLCNRHRHSNPLYPKCLHQRLKRNWMDPDSEAFTELAEVLESTRLLKDLRKLSPHGQTSSLEGFHSTVNQFAPKMLHFGYHGMLARTQLAALHFNENVDRPNRIKKTGEESFKLSFPKSKKGDYTVRPYKIEQTYNYVAELFESLEETVENGGASSSEVAPPALCAAYARPEKSHAVSLHRSRFNKR